MQIFFSIVNTSVIHNSWLVESADAEPQIRKNHILYTERDYKLSVVFQLWGGWALLTPTLFKDQLLFKKSSSFLWSPLINSVLSSEKKEEFYSTKAHKKYLNYKPPPIPNKPKESH